MEDKKTSRTYRVIRWLVQKCSPRYQIDGAERIPEESCVIVGNHCHMYGPIAAELYIPRRRAIWTAGEMMHRKEVAAYAFQDFWSAKPRAVRWFYRLLSHLIPPLSVCIFTNAHTIPVYHDARLITTMRASMDALEQGTSLVIFPEMPEPHNQVVWEFRERFIDLARMYHQRTGKALCFVPLYLSPALKRMRFGEPIRFRPEEPFAAERTRICQALMAEITRMAEALPPHRVVPYPNMPKRDYPMSREESAHEVSAL